MSKASEAGKKFIQNKRRRGTNKPEVKISPQKISTRFEVPSLRRGTHGAPLCASARIFLRSDLTWPVSSLKPLHPSMSSDVHVAVFGSSALSIRRRCWHQNSKLLKKTC